MLLFIGLALAGISVYLVNTGQVLSSVFFGICAVGTILAWLFRFRAARRRQAKEKEDLDKLAHAPTEKDATDFAELVVDEMTDSGFPKIGQVYALPYNFLDVVNTQELVWVFLDEVNRRIADCGLIASLCKYDDPEAIGGHRVALKMAALLPDQSGEGTITGHLPVGEATVFMAYHTDKTDRGRGLIALGNPPRDNNQLIEVVIKERGLEGDAVFDFLKRMVRQTVNNVGKPEDYSAEEFPRRLWKACLAIHRYFGQIVAPTPESLNQWLDSSPTRCEESELYPENIAEAVEFMIQRGVHEDKRDILNQLLTDARYKNPLGPRGYLPDTAVPSYLTAAFDNCGLCFKEAAPVPNCPEQKRYVFPIFIT